VIPLVAVAAALIVVPVAYSCVLWRRERRGG